LIRIEQNAGCAGGNNIAARQARGEILFFLNPDTEVRSDCIRLLAEAMTSDPQVGAAGAKIYWPGTRRIQHAGGVLYPNAVSNHFGKGEEDTGQDDVAREVDYVTGAAIAVRRDVFESIGGFDEDFFPAYYEEADLCARIRSLSYKILYVPGALLEHHEAVTLGPATRRFRRLYHRMRLRYVLKNYSRRELLLGFGYELGWLARSYEQIPELMAAYCDAGKWIVSKKIKRESIRHR
jgi:O-antigen biosynthesis protein